MKPTPARELAQSDPKDLEAIQAALRAGLPTYWIRSTDGCTIDVLINEGVALNAWRVTAERTGLGYRGVQLWKRVGTAFMPYAPPKTVH